MEDCIMKALKFSALLFVFVLSLLVGPVMAQNGISDNDHEALAKHYQSLVDEAKTKLQQNQDILDEYEAHPYYFGRQGQDVRSHASANVREYEKILEENLSQVDLHKRMAMEQQQNHVHKANTDFNRDES
jgi:hypothetical protein